MSIFIVSGTNSPQPTNVVMGQVIKENGELSSINLNIAEITDLSKKEIYESFFNFVGSYVSVEIKNCPHTGNFNHVTPESVETDMVVIDYATLSESEKAKIDNAINALNEFAS